MLAVKTALDVYLDANPSSRVLEDSDPLCFCANRGPHDRGPSEQSSFTGGQTGLRPWGEGSASAWTASPQQP